MPVDDGGSLTIQGVVPCWVQQEPAHKLVNMQGIPVLNVSGLASYLCEEGNVAPDLVSS